MSTIFLLFLTLLFSIFSKVSPSDPAEAQTKSDLSRFVVAATNYQSNNNGKTPFQGETLSSPFVKRYIDGTCGDAAGNKGDSSCTGNDFKNPAGEQYYFDLRGASDISGTAVTPENDQQIIVLTNSYCSTNPVMTNYSSNPRDFVLIAMTEDSTPVCVDNH